MKSLSAALPPPPAEWPHSDGIGVKRRARQELVLVAGVAHREIQVGLARHVEHARLDRAQRLLVVAAEPGRVADVVALPGAGLRDEVVGVAHRVAGRRARQSPRPPSRRAA